MANKNIELTSTLYHFYQNPIAKVSIELFLSIGLVVFLGLFAVRPTLITMSDLVKEIEEKQELEDAMTRKIASLSTAQTEYLTLEERLHVLDQAMPYGPQLIYSTKIIEKAATDNSIIISSITTEQVPDEVQEELQFFQLTKQNMIVRVGVIGDYPSIRNFVESLMQSRRTFIVESVTFSIEENRGNRRLRASIRLNVPYYGKSNAR